jgi:hypothetical protein
MVKMGGRARGGEAPEDGRAERAERGGRRNAQRNAQKITYNI